MNLFVSEDFWSSSLTKVSTWQNENKKKKDLHLFNNKPKNNNKG